MSVRLKWGHVAQLMDTSGPRVNLTRIIEFVRIPEGKPCVVLPIPCHLALMFEADAGDGGVHELKATLVDTTGREHCDALEKVLIFNDVGESHQLLGVFLEIGGWCLAVGDYHFRLSVNAREVGKVPLSVYTADQIAGPPLPVERSELHLKWGHVVEAVEGDDQGTISLEGMTDFIELPPSLDGIILPTLSLALSFRAGPGTAPDHPAKVVLTSPGMTAITARQGTIHLQQVAPGLQMGGVEFITLSEVPLLGIGDYMFHVLVKEQVIGRVPLWVVHPAPVGA